MLAIVYTLIPVVLVIALGWLLKRSSLIGDAHWSGVAQLCFLILFPALLVKTLAGVQIGSTEVLAFAGTVLFAVFAMTGLMLLAYPLMTRRFGVTPAAFTSLFQGATRWHGFVALSIVGFMLGDEATAYMAIVMAVIIPPLLVINILVVSSFADGRGDLRSVPGKVLRNPFVLACLVGGALNVSGIGLPDPVYPVFDMLGSGALGVGLLVVGAGLEFGKVAEHRGLVAFGTVVRLIGMPLLMFAGAWLFGVRGLPLTVAVLAGAVPTASSSYVLARQMGGDAPLMANLITVQVIVSVVTLPLMIWLAQQ